MCLFTIEQRILATLMAAGFAAASISPAAANKRQHRRTFQRIWPGGSD
jgi:hypothetical protein